MPTIKGKDGTVYDVAINLRVARRLVSEFGLDVLSPALFNRDPGLAFAADLALKIHLLDVPKNLRDAKSIAFDKNFSDNGIVEAGATVLEELANFFQRLGLMPELPAKPNTGNGETSTSTPPSPTSKTSTRSRSGS